MVCNNDTKREIIKIIKEKFIDKVRNDLANKNIKNKTEKEIKLIEICQDVNEIIFEDPYKEIVYIYHKLKYIIRNNIEDMELDDDKDTNNHYVLPENIIDINVRILNDYIKYKLKDSLIIFNGIYLYILKEIYFF